MILGNIFIILFLILPAILIISKLECILQISEMLVNDIKLLFTFIFTNFFISCLTSVLNIAEFVTNRMYIYQCANALSYVLKATLVIIFFSFFIPHTYYVGLATCVSYVSTIPLLIMAKKKIFADVKFNVKDFDIKCVTELLGAGIWNTINQCGLILNTGLDLLLSNVLLNQIEMGILSISKTIPNVITTLASSICSSYTAELTIVYANDNKEMFLDKLKKSMKISSVLVSIPIMFLIVLGTRFYALWQPALEASELVILSTLACLSLIPMAGPQVLYNVFTVTNKLRTNSLIVVLSGVLNIILVVLFLNYTKLGLIAIGGISTSLQIIRNMFYTVPFAAKYLGLDWKYFYKDVAVSCMCCITSGVIFYLLQILISNNTWLNLVVISIVGSVISLFINVIIVLKKDERSVLFNSLLTKIKRGGKNG